MKKISDLGLESLVCDLITKIKKDNFEPYTIVQAGDSAHYISSKLSEHFHIDSVKIEGGYRCNSENIILSKSYSLLRKIKKNLFKKIGSGNNYFLNFSRFLVLELYKRNYPHYINLENDYNDKTFNNIDNESKILIVDDNIFTGRIIDYITEFLINKGLKKENIRSATLTAPYNHKPDYYASEEIISFPWNPIGV